VREKKMPGWEVQQIPVAGGVTGFVRDDPAGLPAAIGQAGDIESAACRRHVELHFDVAVMAAGYERVYAAL
jgi:hypothetical protein